MAAETDSDDFLVKNLEIACLQYRSDITR